MVRVLTKPEVVELRKQKDKQNNIPYSHVSSGTGTGGRKLTTKVFTSCCFFF